MCYSKWDVVIAKVYFEDLPVAKIRPMLILGYSTEAVCLKMTGQPPRPGEYILKEWAYAGLAKPTTVRIGKIVSLQRSQISKRVGHLHPPDIVAIQRLINRNHL